MKRFSVRLVVTSFMLILFSMPAAAKWSLLKDYQLEDVAGIKGLCAPSLRLDCSFDVEKYGQDYPRETLLKDMDDARDRGVDMLYDFIQPVAYVPATFYVSPPEKPSVPGEPFFQSRFFSARLTGWESLIN